MHVYQGFSNKQLVKWIPHVAMYMDNTVITGEMQT